MTENNFRVRCNMNYSVTLVVLVALVTLVALVSVFTQD